MNNRSIVRKLLPKIAILLLVLAIAAIFFTALANLKNGNNDEGKRQLERAIRNAAVSCYAVEGFYPPDLDYLIEHYGLQIDNERYTVFYEAIAENLMPDITVIEKLA